MYTRQRANAGGDSLTWGRLLARICFPPAESYSSADTYCFLITLIFSRLERTTFGSSVREQDWTTPEFDHWIWLQKRLPALKLAILNDKQNITELF
jgi:hypothetical protein